jgi:hypothetical protein
MSSAASPANLQRLGATNYTNTSGKPIMVSVYSQGTLIVYVDSIVAAQSTVDNAANSITVIVPVGSTYSCNQTPYLWRELR